MVSVMKHKIKLFLTALFLVFVAQSQELKIVEIYEQDELLKLIANNAHLARVKSDRCQLNQDIQANADVLKIPAYQFLWGYVVLGSVCRRRSRARLVLYWRCR